MEHKLPPLPYAIDALAPGTWLELPDTAMRTVCPPDSPQYEWSFYCQNVILAWGGAALDTTRGRMVRRVNARGGAGRCGDRRPR